jgi:hypothetical protein
LSGLLGPLGGTLVRSEFAYPRVRLGQGVHERRPDQRWEDYYARELLADFGAG